MGFRVNRALLFLLPGLLCLAEARAASSTALTLGELAETLSTHALFELDQDREGQLPVLGVDQVFIDDEGTREVYVKLDLSPRGAPKEEVLPIEGGVVFHRPERSGKITAFFLRGFSEDESKGILETLRTPHPGSGGAAAAIRRMWNRLLPSAHAEMLGCNSQYPISPVISAYRSSLDATSTLAGASRGRLLRLAWPCIKSALIGAARGAGQGATVLFDVVKDPSGYWKNVRRTAQSLYRLITDFETEADGIFEGFRALESTDKAQLLCGFFAEVGTQLLVTVLTHGAGTALLIQKLVSYLRHTQLFSKATLAAGKLVAPARALRFRPGLRHVDDVARFRDWAKGHYAQLWAKDLPSSTAKALDDFNDGKKLASGLIYGDSVKSLSLRGKSPAQLEAELLGRGFTKHHSLVHSLDLKKGVRDPSGKLIPMDVYTHPDGGMVRIKPRGDATSRYRPQPHASKSVRYPPEASYADFRFEAFKVDDLGLALPSSAKAMEAPFPAQTDATRAFVQSWADDVHTNLIPAQ
ncbi:MAG: hypothetical protein NDJ90_12655 [Oligoflexia bacterium]|nr:hypothetical protein [Oligoflexia bacterium]